MTPPARSDPPPRHVGDLEAGTDHRVVADNFPDAAMFVFDEELRHVLVGGRGLTELGVRRDAVEGKTLADGFPEHLVELFAPHYTAVLRGDERRFELEASDRSFAATAVPVVDDAGTVTGGLVTVRDVTTERAATRSLDEAAQRFRTAFDAAPIGMCLVDLDGRFLQVNEALCEMLGYGASDLEAYTFQDITHPEDLNADLAQVERLLTGEINGYQMEKRYYDAAGHIVWALLSVSLMRNAEGDPLYFISQIQDISERKRTEDHLKWAAERDPLTGLWNRNRFEEELNRYEQLARRYGEESAVMLIDIDGFKRVNDTRGHATGDRVLTTIARLLKTSLRITDVGCRFGGDEFAVLLPHTPENDAAALAAQLRSSITEQVQRADRDLHVTVSIGVAAVAGHMAVPAIIRADQAMYAAKRDGTDRT
jgi:diguanylate cyclase (GGDEF)-like protein/PAS domain S-box-containing protein